MRTMANKAMVYVLAVTVALFTMVGLAMPATASAAGSYRVAIETSAGGGVLLL